MPPEQQARLDAMKTKGPEASLSILPVMFVGRPFDRVTDFLGVLLEERGLQHIEIGKVPFTGGVKTEMPALSVSLARFLRTNSIATDYALYVEVNGPTLDEVRAVVMDKSGGMVWSDHQTTRDKAFQALGTPRDPMALLVFLVERLSPQFSLNDETAKNHSTKQGDAFKASSGYPSAGDTEPMPARLKIMKETRQKATLMVLGVRMDRTVNVTSASDLARRIGGTKMFQAAVPANQPVLLEARMAGGDQLKYLWTIAREFQAYVKKNPPDADYVLYADYLFNRQHWQQGGVQFVVCDRHGEWVVVELTNSDQEDYQRIKPISAEGCDKLLVERLSDRLQATRVVTLEIVKVDSEETAGEDGKGANAVDGNPETKWHTQWQAANPAPPHEIVIKLTPACKIKGFTYLPRQDGMENGTIKDYEFFVSNDGKDFGEPVKKGSFERVKEMKTVTFDARTCQFIKLKALSEINDQPWTSVAEINVIPD